MPNDVPCSEEYLTQRILHFFRSLSKHEQARALKYLENQTQMILEDIRGSGTAIPPRPGFIYLIRSGPHYKIGMSKDPRRRFRQIAFGTSRELAIIYTTDSLSGEAELVHTIRTDDMPAAERQLHERFADKRIKGEWFGLSRKDVNWLLEQKEIKLRQNTGES
jgi:hypothetical protein